MDLATEYQRQFASRSWSNIFERLPAVRGQSVLELGCGIGDQAALLVARGARVIGIDSNEELLALARQRAISGAEFRKGDLRSPIAVDEAVDGIWSSFAAAYFPELSERLAAWKRNLKPGGWIALTEVDDLFGHEPVSSQTRTLLESYARDALATGRYDFHMGHKLCRHLESAGFAVSDAFTVEDTELCSDGAADAQVVEGWAARWDRLTALRRFCGADFERARADFLAALSKPGHRSHTTVHCCIATA